MFGEGIGRARLIAGQILDHLRDDVAGALDDDAVARPHAEAADLVAVVQRDVRPHHPADGHRHQPPHALQLSGAPDMDVDSYERGLRPFGGTFMRYRQPRSLGPEVPPLLPVNAGDLVSAA